MDWIWAAFMPHPPIIIPQVGKGRENEASITLAGLKELQKRLKGMENSGRPDVLLILSPHQAYASAALFINSADEINGGLGRFGAPEVNFKLKTSKSIEAITKYLVASGLPVAVAEAANLSLDHGSIVPLHFLQEIFSSIPEVLVANPVGLSPADSLRFGHLLASCLINKDKPSPKWALLASGDLSHRLSPEGPGGFQPEGILFDQDLMSAFKNNSPEDLLKKWPPSRLEAAGECGFRSALTMMGLIKEEAEELSYEGPFGVGYGVAWWCKKEGAQ